MIFHRVDSYTIGYLLKSNQELLLIPPYQRRYSWEEKNWKDLWNDLIELKEEDSHFFGSIVFMIKPPETGKKNIREISDGQQRITTISILLCAIRDFLKKKNKKDLAKTIEEYLWITDLDGHKKSLKLTLGNLDKDSYENLINSDFQDVKNQKINGAYHFFLECLEKQDILEVKKLRDKILENIIYIDIPVQGDEGAYHLFETMNFRGLPLNPVDLIKNYLFMIFEKKSSSEDIEKIWIEIIKNLDGLSEVTFFRQYLMSSKLIGINEKITENKLYEKFKKKIEGYSDLKKLLKDIKNKSELYKKLLNHQVDQFDGSENEEINRLLDDVRIVSITSFTLLLRAFSESNNPKRLIDIMKICNTLLVRRNICGWATGVHDTIFNHLAQNAFEKEDTVAYIKKYLKENTDRYPDNQTFFSKFLANKFTESNITRYYLGAIEEEYFCHGGHKINKSRHKLHIEHIMPQLFCKSLTKIWLNPLGISKKEHEEYKNQIGNLTLLEENPNISASNNSFKVKKTFYTKNKTDIKMTHELLRNNKWNIKKIKERNQELAKIAVKVWNF